MYQSILTGAAALLPSIYLLRYFITNDRYPEPTGVLVRTFVYGVLICIPVVIIGKLLLVSVAWVSSEVFQQLFQAFIVAALCEEGFKLLVLHRYCNTTGHLDEPMDGVVYAVVVSLGFATLENILYVFDGGLKVAVLRACTAVPAHAAFGVMMGYGYASYRFHFGGKQSSPAAVLLVPVLAHGLYDAPLFLLQVESLAEHTVVALGLLLAFIALGVWMYRRVRWTMSVLVAGQMSEDAKASLVVDG